MKKTFIAMALMMVFLVLGGGPVNLIFKTLLGGGVEQSYIYPIYGAIILLTGVIVGATQIIISEIRELKEILKENMKESKPK